LDAKFEEGADFFYELLLLEEEEVEDAEGGLVVCGATLD
jgi:hypothetical protein